jgi:sialic acid synthase SpsE
MVDDVRALERALGGDLRALRAGPSAYRHADGRGVYAARALPAGTVLAADDLKIVRPPRGALPAALPTLLGRRLLHARAADEPVDQDDVA